MTTQEVQVNCYECGRERPIESTYEYELFSTPWDESGTTEYLCHDEFGHSELMKKDGEEPYDSWKYYESCSEILTDSSWADFRYFECEGCYRMVCEQNPSNGWHVQYRIEDECIQVCLKCYQDNILEFGISRESVENGEIAGMFFNYDDPVLKDWDKFIEYRFIASGRDKDELLDEVLENMDSGYKVIIGYERLGIGGGEGSVSVYRKLV